MEVNPLRYINQIAQQQTNYKWWPWRYYFLE